MTQVYVDGQIAYDRRLPGYDLLALSYTAGLNKAGTAVIKMPPGHPAFDAFSPYGPVVEIHNAGEVVFRGRALTPVDDFLNCRTVTCEGERCFFRDAVMRPYLYRDTPSAVFSEIIEIYNSQVQEDKRFIVGTVTVTDPNDYIRLEGQKAEQLNETIDKLVNRCGGYIVFTSDGSGARVVNWYAAVNYSNSQTIDFGSNLLDFTRTTTNTDLATRIIPYGAQDTETGEYVTIESVNNGLDYIEDTEAIALRGIISKPVFYSDVTSPANLLRKAQAELNTSKNLITSLKLTAADLSIVDKDLRAFQPGDLVRVRSTPHKLDDDFLLTDRTVDLLNPGASSISLGKEMETLTGLTTAGDKGSRDELRATEQQITADYMLNIANAVAAAQYSMASLIAQTSESILLEVSENYATNGEVTSAISTSLEQLADSFTFTFNELRTVVDENDASIRRHVIEQESYIRLEDGNIVLGQSAEGSMQLTLENDLIVFKKNGATFGWWDGVDFHTGNIIIEVNERAQFGKFAAVPRNNGHLSWLKVKD